MVSRLLAAAGITVHVWDRDAGKTREMEQKGARGANNRRQLIARLRVRPRIVWMMLPAGDATEETFGRLLALLETGDIIIDGANSHWQDSVRRHREAARNGIGMLDVGVSGGIIATESGYPLMVGGEEATYRRCLPLFQRLGPPEGTALVGDGGSGHYVKMVHNAIEYGMMQAIAEGFDLLKNGSKVDLDVKRIAHLWNHGSIIESLLLKMVERALEKDHTLAEVAPRVEDSGEGRWCVIDAITNGVPFVSNTHAVNARFQSGITDSFALKLLACMRKEFGGHPVERI